ncbi:MAG: hypothetical protein H6748_08590 [Spirochaetaceae bacterium]|nr:hypothetical protein [Spirochaetaceae bacterium]
MPGASLKRALAWLCAAVIIGTLLWGLLPALFNLVAGSDPIGQRLRFLAVGWLYLSFFAAAIAVVSAVPYGLVLLLWAWFSARSPVLERGGHIPWLRVRLHRLASFAGVIQWHEFSKVLPFSFLVAWGALLLPRLVFKSLSPGAFVHERPGAAV